ncbi:LOW QUALITY PROTEIN: hypothetical protein U9M48_035610, partial [Paspalum notatum var. saurae]
MRREFEMSIDGGTSVLPWASDQTDSTGYFCLREQVHEGPTLKVQDGRCFTSDDSDENEDGKKVDQKVYRGMIGSLLYLTAMRPDIQFVVCALVFRHLRGSHTAVKRILRYVKFTPEFGLCYSVDSSFSLLSFSDYDHAGCRLDRKSTSGT